MKIKIFLTLSLLCLSADFLETGSNIRFQRITITDGLSLSSVYCIFQDSKGFMWFGTEDGLNKYDGRNFKVYRPDLADRNSLTYRWIEHISEDKNGNLWFGSRSGLNFFDPRKEVFIQFKNNPGQPSTISNDTITRILLDGSDYIWIGTLNGLNRITLQTMEVEQIKLPSAPQQNLRINDISSGMNGDIFIGTNMGLFSYNSASTNFYPIPLNSIRPEVEKVFSVAQDNDLLWIGTASGLMSFSLPDKVIKHYSIPPHTSGNSNDPSVEKVLPDQSGNLWIVTAQGLLKFDRLNKKFIPVIRSLDTSHSLSVNTVKPIFEDSNGSIWFGTYGSGLYRIQKSTGDISHFLNNPSDPKSISENAINCIYEDRCGRLFFGTFGAGISIYDPQANKFSLLRQNPLDPNSLSSNFVWSVCEDQMGLIWIGTNDKGVNVYSPEERSFTFYDHRDSDPHSLPNSTVKEIFEDSKGRIWIGTDGGGLCKFIRNSGKFISYQSVPADPGTISNNSVRAIFEDRNGILWIGTREGLNRFDPEKQEFKRYLHSKDNTQSISANFIYSSLYQDKNGYLWIGTYGGGLNRMDIENETFTHFQFDPDIPLSISDDIVFSIYEDKNGIFWIGTNSGLNRFDPGSGGFQRFGLKDGLPNEVIYGILPDADNNIWMSTNHGICRFSLIDFSVQNFDVNDGLQSNEFNGGAYHKGKSGRMYFGGVYGLNIVEPDNIMPPEGSPDVVITKLEILGHEVKVLQSDAHQGTEPSTNRITEINGNYYLPQNISFTEEITLDYKYRFFSIEFAALNNPVTGNIQYEYQMENLEDEWNYSGDRNYVSYANMKSGRYNLNIRTLDPDGSRNEKITQLHLTITPPIWESWWFIVLEVFLGLMIAVFIYRYLVKVRTYNLLRIQNEKINAANIRLAESEKNLTEINATKDKFFSIISHDLKNPLTSLLSISESMLKESKADQDEKEHGIRNINESIKHIHALLENLLTWSRSHTGRLPFEQVNFNLAKLIEININLHRGMAGQKHVALVNEVKEDILAFADRDMIHTVVRNLLNNAVKFTPPSGFVRIEAKKEKDMIRVNVTDNGTGISEENIDKLFRIDVKFKTTGTAGEKGTGLGLILCREFIEKNGGTITVESTPGLGSTFEFTVQAGKEDATIQ